MRKEIMKNESWQRISRLALFLAVMVPAFAQPISAQNPEMQEKVAAVKEAITINKQALAQYTWMEQVTISLKGEEKKQEHFRVQVGPDGKPQKTSLDPSPSDDESGGRLKRRIVAKKKEEYKEYADQIKSLIQQYVPPDKGMIEQAYQQGNIMMGPAGGAPGEIRLVISNYIKRGDKMTLVLDKAQMAMRSMSIATYLNDPSDAVAVSAQFDRIPDGPNHVSSQTITGVSKQLKIAVQNSDYRRL
jgi:uncharacterized protein YpmB